MGRKKLQFLKTLGTELPAGSRLLVAVSGGMDSIALWHGCLQLNKKLANQIAAAHVDHGLRVDSSLDAAFVKKLGKAWKCPVYATKLSPPSKSENTEAWGRKVRYDFFRGLAREKGFDYVLTAHHADDVAETLLMRLVSNKEASGIDKFDPRRKLLRPLLSLPRTTIEEYVRHNGLEFRQDSTNRELSFLRNRIRHILIPLLRVKFDPRIVETLAERARAIEDDIAGLYSWAGEEAGSLGTLELGSKDWLRTLRGKLGSLPLSVGWRVIELLLAPKLGFNLGRRHSEAVRQFILGTRVAVQVPGALSLRRTQGGLEIGRTTKPRRSRN